MRTLPSILTIEYIPIAEVTLYPKKILSPGDTTTPLGEFKKLALTEPASSTTTPERTDNGLVYITKVNGSIFDDASASLQHSLQINFNVYRLTDVYKNKFLIGTEDKPFPEILFFPVNEAADGGRRLIDFEITWKSTLPPIDIIDL